ncbi:MAG: helicase-associated domain-containing protein [Anaerolineae bacterium]|nr:helicase-associated domain-containing protein [Candidatus Roseilinea sp.]MDW8449590.1 helicase-associated domain-containing protein [Anaerolineae bacterium]
MHSYKPENPLIVQSDRSVLLEVDNPHYTEARDALARFAELEKSPEYVHTYRISPLSLWNAAAAGLSADAILADLEKYSKYPLPENIKVDIRDAVGRYGRVRLTLEDGRMLVIADDPVLGEELARHRSFAPLVKGRLSQAIFEIDPAQRGHVKRVLLQIGYPAEDLAGYVDGAPLHFDLRQITLAGQPFALRHYQADAAEVYWAQGSAAGGSGVVVLPCGAGKTIVGIAAMHKAQCATLILTPNTVAVRQWIREILDKTTLTEDQVGEYSGLKKDVRPVTICTYQVLTYHHRKREVGSEKSEATFTPDSPLPNSKPSKRLPKISEYPHMALFNSMDWGLIIYDEVHLLPAPVFRVTAEIQARRRLGLTATLVREDGMEGDVFSLVGPKKYDVPWKDLERQGWIATAECHEIRVALADEDRMEYAVTGHDQKYHFAAANPRKLQIVSMLMAKHKDDDVLIIGQYIPQLEQIAQRLGAPLITGETPVRQREKLFQQFREGQIRRLVLSKVGNFSIDLPDANVLIQVSGMFGSRQEEAQRLGRVLRPKQNGLLAHFYTIVTRDTLDQEYAAKRQLFLTEQGYHYDILYEEEVPGFTPALMAVNAAPVRRTGGALDRG